MRLHCPLGARMQKDGPTQIARRIVAVMVDGACDEAALRERMMYSFKPLTPWLVARAVAWLVDEPAPHSQEALVARLLVDSDFQRAFACGKVPRRVRWRPTERELPSPRIRAAGLPDIESPMALAQWLGIAPGRLAWLADPWGQEARREEGALRNYRYGWRAREYGPDRLIEIPKAQLRGIQRRLHRELLAHIPVHDAAHGFVRGRSPLTHAQLHAGRAAVLRIDLEQFFAGIDAARVAALFRLVGYAPAVATLLAGLCTNNVPTAVLASAPHCPLPFEDRMRLRHAHLPQGAPSSPALANALAWRLDVRLSAWAARRGLAYSRYADDLTLSGDGIGHRALRRRAAAVVSIVEDCGFRVNHRKTCCFGAQHSQRVTGLVVNAHPNIARADYDRLKAILTRCVRHDPATENREGHADFRAWLQGRVAWCASVNPRRGEKLQRLFARIRWDGAGIG